MKTYKESLAEMMKDEEFKKEFENYQAELNDICNHLNNELDDYSK